MKAAVATERKACIYFIRAGKRGPIKIGITTTEPIARAQALQSGNHTEAAIHKKFRSDRFQGEWFRPSARLMQFIRNHAKQWDGIQPRTDRFRGRPLLAKVRVISSLPPPLLKDVDAIAKSEFRSRADVIGEAVEKYLASRHKKSK